MTPAEPRFSIIDDATNNLCYIPPNYTFCKLDGLALLLTDSPRVLYDQKKQKKKYAFFV